MTDLLTEELWKMFFKHEQVASTLSLGPEHRLASATMANAIARLLVESKDHG